MSTLRRCLLALPFLVACGGTDSTPTADAGAGADAGVGADSGARPDGGVELDAGAVDAGPPPPSFEADVAPILEFQCQGCHFVTDNPPQILVTGQETRATYDRLVDRPAGGAPLDYVEPGAPEDSYLLHKIEGTHRDVGGEGNHMPPPQARRRVPPADVAIIRGWIEAGASF